jgi:3-oxoacyl-[acyl-carrier-protein] synthase II
MSRRRVVVTGLGTVNALGHNVEDFWAAIKAGKSGVGPITKFDTADYTAKIAAEIKDFDPSKYVDRKEARKMDSFTLYAVHAAQEAMEDSGLVLGENGDKSRTGVILGNGIGGIESLEVAYEKLYLKGGGTRIPPMTIPKLIANEAPANVAIATGAMGPNYALLTACSAGTDAIGAAAMWIRSGHMDAMITGGTEAAITMMGIGGFCVLKAVTSDFNDAPEKGSRPFDKDRSGFVMGEGAGVLVLEEYEHAKARGAKIYAELAGYGMSCDANHLTAPHPEGDGAILAVDMAVKEAGIDPSDVNYINAHGTSTPLNDPTETKMIKRYFGKQAYKLKMSSTKSMTGHCIGAAGGLESIISILAIRDQFAPPTINLDNPDLEAGCDLDYVPNKGVDHKIDVALSSTLGFGGHNGIAIFKKI